MRHSQKHFDSSRDLQGRKDASGSADPVELETCTCPAMRMLGFARTSREGKVPHPHRERWALPRGSA